MEQNRVRVAAVADTHCRKGAEGYLGALFTKANAAADILLLCGDLTDTGAVEEAQILAEQIKTYLKIPVIAVLGNHDFESNMQARIKEIIAGSGVTVLDGTSCQKLGIGFAGVKGFGGGFGKYQLQPWGEKELKIFVQEAQKEGLRLSSALAQLNNPVTIVLMHYSPIRATVEGEACEIFPFLGSSHLESPIDQFGAAYVFHGHAHHGTGQGYTSSKVPVFNVSLPMLLKAYPDAPAFRVVEVLVQEKT